MSQKRITESTQDYLQTKLLKTMDHYEDVGDIIVDTSRLNDDVTCSLTYDLILRTYSIPIEKDRDEGPRCICVSHEDIGTIIKHLQVVEKLVARYSLKRSPQRMDLPFQVNSGQIGDMVTVVSLKERSYKRGTFDVDIRKCIIKEDQNYQYTCEGVRLDYTLISGLREKLLYYQFIISDITEKTREVISVTTAFTISMKIRDLHDPKQNFQGCITNHPSQKQHMGVGGCMTEEQPTWSELCEQYWSAAKNIVTDDFVQDLAQRAVRSLPDLQETFLPCLISTEQIPEMQVRDLVERKAEIEDTELFKMLMEIY